MQRTRITKTIIYLRVFILLFTAYTILYGVKMLYGISQVLEIALLSALITAAGAGALLLYYGTLTLRQELRRRCGCYVNCRCG